MPITDVERTTSGKSLVLRLENGVNEKGDLLIASKTFSNVREGASDADILNSANTLASLQNKDVAQVIVQEKVVLIG